MDLLGIVAILGKMKIFSRGQSCDKFLQVEVAVEYFGVEYFVRYYIVVSEKFKRVAIQGKQEMEVLT